MKAEQVHNFNIDLITFLGSKNIKIGFLRVQRFF